MLGKFMLALAFVATGCSGSVSSGSMGGDNDGSVPANKAGGLTNGTASPKSVEPDLAAHLRYPTTQTQSPIGPEVALRLHAIADIDAARNDDMFMKVGDSITESYAVMSCFADPTMTTLDAYGDLESIIDFYRNANVSGPSQCTDDWCANAHTAYNRNSYAARGGSTADMPLTPRPGETQSPLAMEDAAITPRAALIEFGTNDSSIVTTPADFVTFYTNMEALLSAAEQRGLIPVLYTVPPRDPSNAGTLNIPTINAIIRVLAQRHAIPLIDFYRESLPLPAWGLWDGTHPTQADGGACRFDPTSLFAGFNVRNLLSIEALQRVHAVLGGAEAPDVTVKVDGEGTVSSPFIVDALPFGDSGDASAAAVTYRFAPTVATRLRVLVFSTDPSTGIAIGGAAPASVVQQSLDAGTYQLTVSGGAYDVVFVSCDPTDPVCS